MGLSLKLKREFLRCISPNSLKRFRNGFIGRGRRRPASLSTAAGVKVGSELSIDTTNARGRTKHSTFELRHEARKPLERFRPQLTEYSPRSHQNRVTGFPRPAKTLAASRRKVVSRSLPATLDRYPHGLAGHVAIPNRSIRACEPLERFRPQPAEYSRR